METHTIKNTTKAMMLAVAGCFDITQALINLIPFMGQVLAIFLGIFAQMTFWLWFKMNGISYNSTKRMTSFAMGTLVGFIPLLDALPELTLEVFMILSTITIEQKVEEIAPVVSKIENTIQKNG